MPNDNTPKTFDQAAAKLYGSTPAPAGPAATLVSSAPASPAASGPNPNGLYPPGDSVRRVIESRAEDLFKTRGATPAEREQMQDLFHGIARTSSLPEHVVTDIAGLYIDSVIADAKPDAKPVEDAAIIAGNTAIREAFIGRWGLQDGEAMLGRVKKFVGGYPDLRRVLGQGLLGARVDLAVAIGDHVWSNGLGR